MENQTLPEVIYQFRNIITGLETFIGNFEKKVQLRNPNIPIYVLDTGDESYFQRYKFEDSENKEIYLKVPRIVLTFEDFLLEQEQNTMQYNKILYNLNNVNYRVTARRQSTKITVGMDFVVSNFIKALEYVEMIASLLSIDNVYTYEFLGNTYEASYAATTFTVTKNSNDASSGTKNYNIKSNIDVTLQPMFIRYESIERNGGKGSGDGSDGFRSVFEIESNCPLYKDGIDTENPTKIEYDKNNPNKR